MRTEEELRAEMANLQKAIIEEEEEDWLPWEIADNLRYRNPLASALMTLAMEWALGEERWRKA